MIISHRHKFIFFHVHKVAGTSISHALRPYASWPCESLQTKLLQRLGYVASARNFTDHVTAAELRAAIDSKTFEQYYKFAFVRDPWDWQVSLYLYILKNQNHANHTVVKAMSGFEEYLTWRTAQPSHKPWSLQKNFVTDSTGQLIVDFVGRYETLHDDFETALKRIGLSACLPHLNRTQSVDYRDFYTETTSSLLADYYQDDVELFGYHRPLLPASL